MAIQEIYVSGGSFDTPFYNFYYDNLGTQRITTLSLISSKPITFLG